VRLATGVDARRLDALAAPASLQVLVASRLDLLSPRERSVITAASVLGQTFGRGALQAVTELPDDDLAAALRELIARDWLTTVTDRLSSEEGQYAFVQTVVRTVAYQTQSKRDRLQRHLAVVDYLEAASDGDGLSAVIAQHLRDALAATATEDPNRAGIAARLGDWLERSAARSLAIGAPADAFRAFAEALGLAGDQVDRVRLQLAAADAALAAGANSEAVDYARPIAIGDLPATPLEVTNAAITAAIGLRYSRRSDDAWDLLEPYMGDDALASLPPLVAAKVAYQVSALHQDLARREEAIPWSERALRLAEDAGDARTIAEALGGLALTYFLRGMPRIGTVILDHAAEFSRENRLVSTLARVLVNQLAMGVGRDVEGALIAGREALTVSEQSGDTNLGWLAAVNLTFALTLAGRWDEVATVLDRPLLHERPPERVMTTVAAIRPATISLARGAAIDLAEYDALADGSDGSGGDTIDTVYYLTMRALHARATGQPALLVPACHRIVELAFKYMAFEDDFPHLWALAVDLLLDVQQFSDARELLRPVEDVPANRLGPLLAAELARLQGTIEVFDPASTADPAQIELHLRDAIARLDAVGARPDRARAQAALGVWLWRSGRTAEAARQLDAARATFTELGAAVWLRDLDETLAQSAVG
jgi:tetratricopeptide (TPR) repeat protein